MSKTFPPLIIPLNKFLSYFLERKESYFLERKENRGCLSLGHVDKFFSPFIFLVLPSGVSNPCSRPSNTVTVAVLSVFVVVFLLIIIITCCSCMIIYYKRRAENKKSSRQSIYSGSLHRSLSGSSYSSQGSHGQHRYRNR